MSFTDASEEGAFQSGNIPILLTKLYETRRYSVSPD